MSPCNCGQARRGAYKFVYIAPNGTRTTYNTEIEAKAAKIRNGGGSITTVKAA